MLDGVTDTYVPREVEAVLDRDEPVLWSGKPSRVPFLLRGVPFLVFGLVWGALDAVFICVILQDDEPGPIRWFAIPFFALHLLPFWLGVGNMVRLLLAHRNTMYVFTDRRVVVRSGAWGSDLRTTEYAAVSDVEVKANPVDNVFGVGTIEVHLRSGAGRGATKFVGVPRPHEVFRRIKDVIDEVRARVRAAPQARDAEPEAHRWAGRDRLPSEPP